MGDICPKCCVSVALGDRTAVTSGGKRYHDKCATALNLKPDPRPVCEQGEDLDLPHYFGNPPRKTQRQAVADIRRMMAR